MRIFQIVLEIIWIMMGGLCLYLGVKNISLAGNSAFLFFILSLVAFAMGAYRFFSRRKRERAQHDKRWPLQR